MATRTANTTPRVQATPVTPTTTFYNVEEARAYLVSTATGKGSMSRQGTVTAIGRLNPAGVVKLANAVAQANAEGIPAGVFSAYRGTIDPSGYKDKTRSMHGYGLAIDVSGIDGPGSKNAVRFNKIAKAQGIFNPYGPYKKSEFNHYQFVPEDGQTFLRKHPEMEGMMGVKGPNVPLETLWAAGAKGIPGGGAGATGVVRAVDTATTPEAIRDLQTKLNTMADVGGIKSLTIPVDGEMGPRTQGAIMALKGRLKEAGAYNGPIDATMDTATWRAATRQYPNVAAPAGVLDDRAERSGADVPARAAAPTPAPATGAALGSYDTKLTPAEETKFQQWKAANAPNDSGADYDLRGAFKAGLQPAENGHWSDEFKKPNHPTFSDQSRYSTPEHPGGHWYGDNFVRPGDSGPRGPDVSFSPRAAAAAAPAPATAPDGGPRTGAALRDYNRMSNPEMPGSTTRQDANLKNDVNALRGGYKIDDVFGLPQGFPRPAEESLPNVVPPVDPTAAVRADEAVPPSPMERDYATLAAGGGAPISGQPRVSAFSQGAGATGALTAGGPRTPPSGRTGVLGADRTQDMNALATMDEIRAVVPPVFWTAGNMPLQGITKGQLAAVVAKYPNPMDRVANLFSGPTRDAPTTGPGKLPQDPGAGIPAVGHGAPTPEEMARARAALAAQLQPTGAASTPPFVAPTGPAANEVGLGGVGNDPAADLALRAPGGPGAGLSAAPVPRIQPQGVLGADRTRDMNRLATQAEIDAFDRQLAPFAGAAASGPRPTAGTITLQDLEDIRTKYPMPGAAALNALSNLGSPFRQGAPAPTTGPGALPSGAASPGAGPVPDLDPVSRIISAIKNTGTNFGAAAGGPATSFAESLVNGLNPVSPPTGVNPRPPSISYGPTSPAPRPTAVAAGTGGGGIGDFVGPNGPIAGASDWLNNQIATLFGRDTVTTTPPAPVPSGGSALFANAPRISSPGAASLPSPARSVPTTTVSGDPSDTDPGAAAIRGAINGGTPSPPVTVTPPRPVTPSPAPSPPPISVPASPGGFGTLGADRTAAPYTPYGPTSAAPAPFTAPNPDVPTPRVNPRTVVGETAAPVTPAGTKVVTTKAVAPAARVTTPTARVTPTARAPTTATTGTTATTSKSSAPLTTQAAFTRAVIAAQAARQPGMVPGVGVSGDDLRAAAYAAGGGR